MLIWELDCSWDDSAAGPCNIARPGLFDLDRDLDDSPSTLPLSSAFIPKETFPSLFPPSFLNTNPPLLLPVKSTTDILLHRSPTAPSLHRCTPSSRNATFLVPRSQLTTSAPRPSCTCPQTSSRGLTRHSASLSAGHPAARRVIRSSRWNLGGVCVIRMSVSRGMASQAEGQGVGKAQRPQGGE